MDVMMKMTTEDVRRLRAQFSAPLTLEQFVPLMKMNLRDRIANELDFVVGAVDLFHTIDANGDRALDWDEFAGYMLDAGQAKADFGLDTDGHDEKLYQRWPLSFRDAKTPMNCIKTHVQQLLYLPDMPAVAYFERGADIVSIYALHFDQSEAPRHYATIRLHTAFQEHVVLDMCYVPVKKWLAISSMRGALAYLSVWQMPEPSSHSRSPMMLRRIELVSPQELLTWLPTLQLLATASAVFPPLSATPSSGQKTTKIHQLLLWDLSTLTTQTGFDHRDRIKGVISLVGFATPSNRVFLVVGREDGQITVVETESGRDVQTLDAHGHGVRVLAYSSDCEVLASAGAHAYASDESSLHILIWRIHSSGKLSVEATLRDHDAPLQLLRFVEAKHQLLSADIHGVFHVYSSAGRSPALEKWQCLQVFDAGYRINECVLVPESALSDAVLITAGSHIEFFDLCASREREEVFFAYYCRELNLVVAVTATTLLLWIADTGRLWKTFTYASIVRSTPPSGFNDAANDDSRVCRAITSVCVDDRERKLLLGDDRGSVRIVNILNGNVMKALDPHTSAVLWLSYVLRSKRVISISLDSVLHVSDENNPTGYYVPFGSTKPQSVVLRALRFLPDSPPPTISETLEDYRDPMDSPPPPRPPARFEITRAVGNQELDLLAVLVSGTLNGENFIQLWNFDMSHAQGTCIAPNQEEITCLSFLGHTPDIVGGTTGGTVLLWTAIPVEGIAYTCAYELIPELEQIVEEPSDEEPQQVEPQEAFTVPVPPTNGPILYVLTVSVDIPQSATTDEAVNPETSTFLTADGAPTGTSATNVQTMQSKSASSNDVLSNLAKNRRADEMLRYETEGGIYVVAGDEAGVITTWLIVHATTTIRKQRPASHAEPQRPTAKGQNNTALLQHEETAIGYDAVAAFHANSLKRKNLRSTQPCERCRARARWQAHRSAITSLRQSTGDPLVLLSSSASGKVKVWNVYGELLGVLDHFATRRVPERRPWRFPDDVEKRRQQKEAFASQFLDRNNSRGGSSKRDTARMTVLQARLSMTPQEMASERSTPKSAMRRRITTVVQLGDVERAIRNLALSQVSSSLSKRSGSRARARSVASTPIEPSLHVVLSEVSSMEPPKSAPAGDSGSQPPVDADRYPAGVAGGRRRYSMVTVEDLKHALRPRSRMSQQMTSKARSSAAVHCDLTPLPPTSSLSTREVIVTASPATDGRIELTDLRGGGLERDDSNQECESNPHKKRADGVLNYHVKLAHSWNKYAT